MSNVPSKLGEGLQPGYVFLCSILVMMWVLADLKVFVVDDIRYSDSALV